MDRELRKSCPGWYVSPTCILPLSGWQGQWHHCRRVVLNMQANMRVSVCWGGVGGLRLVAGVPRQCADLIVMNDARQPADLG